MSETQKENEELQHQLSAEEKAELLEIFNLVDEDRGGSISKEELQHLMSTVGIHTTQQEIDKIVAEIDENNDGEIQFEEFVAVMSRKVNASYSSEEVIEAFRLFAGDSPPGHISLEQLEIALTQYGTNKLTIDKAIKLIENLETDENGYFNFDQYVNLMMQE